MTTKQPFDLTPRECFHIREHQGTEKARLGKAVCQATTKGNASPLASNQYLNV